MGDVVDLAHERARRRGAVPAFVAQARTAGLDLANIHEMGRPAGLSPCRAPLCATPSTALFCPEHTASTVRF